jgi:hypothetical protein
MDFFACGYFEACTKRRAHTTKTSLIATIKEKLASLDRDMVTRACGRFRGRVKAVIEVGGDFIKIR